MLAWVSPLHFLTFACISLIFTGCYQILLGVTEFLIVNSRLDTSDIVLSTIQDKIKWAETMCEENKKHKMEVKSHLQDVKKSLHSKVRWFRPFLWILFVLGFYHLVIRI